MKTGKELIEFIKQAEPLHRAEYLKNVLEPEIFKGLNAFDNSEIKRDEALKRAAEIFDCPVSEIAEGFNNYGYYLPNDVIKTYFWDNDRHHFIPEISRVNCERGAKILFTEVVKKEIDLKIDEQGRLNLPIHKTVSKIKEQYKIWSLIPEAGQDMTTYYCWIDFIEPYLKDFLIPHPIEIQKLRLPAAFCVCMDYIEGKFDISGMTKETLTKYVIDKFQEGLSAQKIVNTLLGYLPDKKNEKEKAFFTYNDKGKNWHFRQDNFDYMRVQFAEEYSQAEKMQSKLK